MKPINLVYIAGKFSAPTREGVEENIKAATKMGLAVARLGYMPIIPHANTAHPEFEKVQPYDFWIAGTLRQLEMCDAVMLVPGWKDSNGALGEVTYANELGIPVFEELDALASWLE